MTLKHTFLLTAALAGIAACAQAAPDDRGSSSTTKVLTKKTFINGALHFPGDVVELDANEATGYAPAGSTPLGVLTDDQLIAELARRQGGSKSRLDAATASASFSSNVADPTETNTGSIPMPVGDIAPRSPGTNAPQGLPPGAEQQGNRHLLPAADDAPGAVQEVIGGSLEPLPTIQALEGDASKDGKLTKAEIIEELKVRGVEFDGSAKRDDLYALLVSTPPKA